MSRIAPKPIISNVLGTWDVPPGMKIALVQDIECQLWIIESCPAGTHFWTLAQAQMLPQSGRTGAALRNAIMTAQKICTPSTTNSNPTKDCGSNKTLPGLIQTGDAVEQPATVNTQSNQESHRIPLLANSRREGGDMERAVRRAMREHGEQSGERRGSRKMLARTGQQVATRQRRGLTADLCA